MKGIILIAIVALVAFLAWYMMQQNDNSNGDDIVNGDDIPVGYVDINTCDIYALAFVLMMRYYDQIDRTIKLTSIGTTFNITDVQLNITLMSGSGRLSYIQRQNALLQIERYD